ncbi:MAG: FGGY-family carbohydrate kinase [Casimicrobiaceae bacterium]
MLHLQVAIYICIQRNGGAIPRGGEEVVRYVIGVDGGTESLRAHVLDFAGNSLGAAKCEYATEFPSPGRAEQDPRDWWRALVDAVRGATCAAGVDPRDIGALALDTTSCSVVAADANGEPLRPAILWMDVRATEEADLVLRTGDVALTLNCAGAGPVSAEWMIPKALWLKRHERALYERAATIFEYQDFLVKKLTGRTVASLTNVAIRWHYRARAGGWPRSMLAALDFADVEAKWPTEIVAAGEVIGPLTADAAAHLGLDPSTHVVQGGIDAFIGMIGLGVARPGQVALITGSSHLQLAVTNHAMSVAGLWGSYADAVYPGRHILEGGQTASGSMIAWLGRFIGTDADLAALNREAAALAPGSEGLVVLDHFQGTRTPYTDSHSRGAIVGLSLGHGRAHVFRAMIEGIAFGTRAILDCMTAAGVRVDELAIGGGASRSPLWVQIHADTAGCPVKVAAFADAPVLGSAILAAVGSGAFDDIDSAIDAMVRFERVVDPDPRNGERYSELFERYARLYPALKAWRDGSMQPAVAD